MTESPKAGTPADNDRGRLLISCPDCPGIVAAVSEFLFRRGANIVHSSQYSTAPAGGRFFMRVVFDLPGFADDGEGVAAAFTEVADRFHMQWRIEHAARRKRLAIFLSKQDHCLLELLWQWRAGDLYADIAMVISNHADSGDAAVSLGIPFYHVPVLPDAKEEAERRQLELLDGQVDVIVLARYMQILSSDFCRLWPQRIINIHHSFLPAFVGARPHEQALRAGVKLIGATGHYVTDELDAGPIIEQDVERVDHRHTADDLVRIGRLIERRVLARAVRWHVEDRVLVHERGTVVFT
jgi:formyltetrahydrofolate deformylase